MSEKINNKKYTINNINKTNKTNNTDDYECIGPCYPPNTFYYNPHNLHNIINTYPSCAIKEQKAINPDGSIYKKTSTKCHYDDDKTKDDTIYFDIFSDYIQIATNSNNFLSQIYNIYNISDVINFLSNSIDVLPIYSQKRLLSAIYETYYKYIEFPKLLFAKKLLIVLKNIYKIIDLDENKILHKLNNLESTNSEYLYNLFI